MASASRSVEGPAPAEGLRAIATTAIALAFLQVALATYYWLPDLDVARLVAPTWELLALVAVVAAASAVVRRTWTTRALGIALTALVLLGLILGFGQGLARHEFGYDVELAIDLRYVPVLLGMMWHTDPLAWFVVHILAIAIAIAVAVGGTYLSIRRVQTTALRPRGRNALLVVAGAAGGLAALTTGVSGPLTSAAIAQVDFALHEDARLGAIAREIERERRGARFELGPRRPSILFIVVESYGTAVFEQARFADVRARLGEAARALAADGYAARTRVYRSPVFGGSSWMADSTTLCGVRVENQKRYAALNEAAVECLPGALRRYGYRTVMAASNTTFVDDAFRALFPFDRFYLKDDLGYVGPRFSWSYVPDQFVLNALDRLEVARPRTEPLFVFYMLTSSHHPWRRVPPYLERWDELGDGAIYRTATGATFANNFVSGDRYAAGFGASTAYALRSVFDYLRRLPPADAPLIIVMGDHQPRKPVADMDTDGWTVPVHVLSRDSSLVEGFAAGGFAPGLTPVADKDARGLEHLAADVTTALGGGP